MQADFSLVLGFIYCSFIMKCMNLTELFSSVTVQMSEQIEDDN